MAAVTICNDFGAQENKWLLAQSASKPSPLWGFPSPSMICHQLMSSPCFACVVKLPSHCRFPPQGLCTGCSSARLQLLTHLLGGLTQMSPLREAFWLHTLSKRAHTYTHTNRKQTKTLSGKDYTELFTDEIRYLRFTSLEVQTVKNLPVRQEIRVPSLGWEDSLEKEMAIHSSILAWRIL